jgi:hypothetical protein
MTKEERREAMPLVTEFVDDIVSAFGSENIQRIKASENGHVIDWQRKEERAA